MTLPSVTSAPAPTRQLRPITARLSTIAWMPISEPSPTVQPCSIAWWPMVTSVAQRQRAPGIGVQHRAVLHVAVVADQDRFVVAAYRRAGPHAGAGAERHPADDGRVVGDPGVGIDAAEWRSSSWKMAMRMPWRVERAVMVEVPARRPLDRARSLYRAKRIEADGNRTAPTRRWRLALAEPSAKCAAVAQSGGRRCAPAPIDVDPAPRLDEPDGLPGRPPRPRLVPPTAVPRRSRRSRPRAAPPCCMRVAHIEFNAINLALDAIWRFAGMPVAYYLDWLRVAARGGRCTSRCSREHLAALGHAYGDFDGARRPVGDGRSDRRRRARRMALVPRTLEARGLDATPPMQRQAAQGRRRSARSRMLDVILRDEVGHVADRQPLVSTGCASRDGLDPVAEFRRARAPTRGPAAAAAAQSGRAPPRRLLIRRVVRNVPVIRMAVSKR